MITVNINPADELFKTLNQTCDGRCNDSCFHHTPVIFNFSMNTTCPLGFYPGSQSCECLINDSVTAISQRIRDHLSGIGGAWASTYKHGHMIYAVHCPFNYCIKPQMGYRASNRLIRLKLPDESSQTSMCRQPNRDTVW